MSPKSSLFIVALVSIVLVVCKCAPYNGNSEDDVTLASRDDEVPLPIPPVDPETQTVIDQGGESVIGDEGNQVDDEDEYYEEYYDDLDDEDFGYDGEGEGEGYIDIDEDNFEGLETWDPVDDQDWEQDFKYDEN